MEKRLLSKLEALVAALQEGSPTMVNGQAKALYKARQDAIARQKADDVLAVDWGLAKLLEGGGDMANQAVQVVISGGKLTDYTPTTRFQSTAMGADMEEVATVRWEQGTLAMLEPANYFEKKNSKANRR